MAEIDPRSLSFEDEELLLGKDFNPYGGSQPAPRQIIAEVGDDFPTLADKLGIETSDLVNANPDTSGVSAGAVYNVPTPVYDVPTKPDSMTTEEWLASLNQQPAQDQEKLNVFKDALDFIKEGGNYPGGLPGLIDSATQPIRDFFFPDDEQSLNLGGKPLASPIDPRVPQAEYADFRKAEAEAGLRDREPIPQNLLQAEIASGLYGDEFLGLGGGVLDIQTPENQFTTSGRSFAPDPTRPFEMPAHPSENPEIFADIRASGGDAQAAYDEAVQEWDDAIMAHYEEGSGYGGGIPGWIEEKTGIVGIDPWNMTPEEFDIFLAAFDTEELNYLEAHGILVPEGVYTGGGTPIYGSGGTSVRQPVGYGGFSSQKPSYANRESYLGLTSWSI